MSEDKNFTPIPVVIKPSRDSNKLAFNRVGLKDLIEANERIAKGIIIT